MNNTRIIELEAKSVRFFSEYDEAAFFEWLSKISCVQSYKGYGNSLYILVNCDVVEEADLRELLALFHRYGIAMGPLSVFNRQEFEKWFHDIRAYWYQSVFG